MLLNASFETAEADHRKETSVSVSLPHQRKPQEELIGLLAYSSDE